MGEQPVRRVLLYGELPRGPDGARSGRGPAPPGDAPGRPDLAPAAARPREAVLRVHGVLGLPHVGAVPGDLVREPAGGDLFHLLPPHRPMEAGGRGGVLPGARDSVRRPAGGEAEEVSAHPARVRRDEPRRHLAGALSRDRAVDQRRSGPGARRPGGRRHPAVRRTVSARDRLGPGALPDDFAPSRRRYAGAGATLIGNDVESRDWVMGEWARPPRRTA